jgi:hypothetical protein
METELSTLKILFIFSLLVFLCPACSNGVEEDHEDSTHHSSSSLKEDLSYAWKEHSSQSPYSFPSKELWAELPAYQHIDAELLKAASETKPGFFSASARTLSPFIWDFEYYRALPDTLHGNPEAPKRVAASDASQVVDAYEGHLTCGPPLYVAALLCDRARPISFIQSAVRQLLAHSSFDILSSGFDTRGFLYAIQQTRGTVVTGSPKIKLAMKVDLTLSDPESVVMMIYQVDAGSQGAGLTSRVERSNSLAEEFLYIDYLRWQTRNIQDLRLA